MARSVLPLLVALFLFLQWEPLASRDSGAVTAGCRERPRDLAGDASLPVTWHFPTDEKERQALARWCGAVGPAVIEPEPRHGSSTPAALDSVVMASWNVHVGGADLAGFVEALRRGDFTAGAPVRDFVLLLQEAHRAGSDVPARIPAKAGMPSRIAPSPPAGVRRDVVSIAHDLGLALFYAPSMRNGPDSGHRAEDRGNAILSTLPLSDFSAIELPFERQRRVAIAAAVRVAGDRGRPSRLRVSSAHLDATAGMARLRIFASGLRARQARALVSTLDDEAGPIVMGSDLNTWWGGPHEPAYRALTSLFSATPPMMLATHSGGLMLDYLLFRLPSQWRGEVRRADDRFGSDHSPLIGRLVTH